MNFKLIRIPPPHRWAKILPFSHIDSLLIPGSCFFVGRLWPSVLAQNDFQQRQRYGSIFVRYPGAEESEGCKQAFFEESLVTALSLIVNFEQIDWNKVAHNPILSQEITNGHAARMRYSRFRSSLLGIEPQRRNRNPKDSNKSKVTKSKKEAKSAKKEKDDQAAIKSDPGVVPQPDATAGSPKVKNEASPIKKEATQNGYRFTTASELSPLATTLPDTTTQLHFTGRLLTPCSDSTELFAPSHGSGCGAFISATSPISGNDAMLHLHHHHHHHETEATGFDYTTAASEQQQQQQSASPWHPTSPSYSPFQLPSYELDNFNSAAAASGYCDHTQHHHHAGEGFGISPSAMMAPDHTHAPVKHEEWDSGFH